jgi:hypothetical protein
MSDRNDLLAAVKDYLAARADAHDANYDIDPPTGWMSSALARLLRVVEDMECYNCEGRCGNPAHAPKNLESEARPFVSTTYPTREDLPPKAQALLTHVLDRGAWCGTGDRYGQLLVRHGYAKKTTVDNEPRIVGL